MLEISICSLTFPVHRLRELRLQYRVRRRRHLRPGHRAVRLSRGRHWPELRPLSRPLGPGRQRDENREAGMEETVWL